jgi:hypothetical protein
MTISKMKESNAIEDETPEIGLYMMLNLYIKKRSTFPPPLKSLLLVLQLQLSPLKITESQGRTEEGKSGVVSGENVMIMTRSPVRPTQHGSKDAIVNLSVIPFKKKLIVHIGRLLWQGRLHLKSFVQEARLQIHPLCINTTTKAKRKRKSSESSLRQAWKNTKRKGLTMLQMQTLN